MEEVRGYQEILRDVKCGYGLGGGPVMVTEEEVPVLAKGFNGLLLHPTIDNKALEDQIRSGKMKIYGRTVNVAAPVAQDHKWDHRFMLLAHEIAQWSKDPSHKVGCVIIDDDRNILATGFNGFPRGVEDSTERYIDRDTKLLMTVHAEANAVAMAGRPRLKGGTAYVTLRPCCQCAALLIQAGVKSVVVQGGSDGGKWMENMNTAEAMLREAGVEYRRLG